MWMTKVSPTFSAGSPVKSCSIPDASMATWPAGLRTMSKMADGGAGIGRVTSMRSGRKTVSGMAAYSCTNSISVPKDVLGCTKATVVPRDPGRGASSITRPPASLTACSATPQSSTR